MAAVLSNIQLRVERSIYEAIRLQLVAQGYLPDITDTEAYPDNSTGQQAWDTALAAIQQAMEFGIEVFGDSSSLQKGLKRVPRIAIIPRRIMPGDIGKTISGQFSPDPLDPDSTQKLIPTYQSANLQLDINVVPADADQERILHAIIGAAIGSSMAYLPFYDNPMEYFFIRQFNFFDLPDDRNGIAEKVYSYEIPDLYLYEGDTEDISTIQQITINLTATDLKAIYQANGNLIGPYVSEDVMYMDLNGLKYAVPA